MLTYNIFCIAPRRMSHTALGIVLSACLVAHMQDASAQPTWGGQGSRVQPISQQQQPTSGYLGVYIQDLTEDLAMYLNFEGRHGVVVREVVEGSPAAQAGLQRGDVLVRVGDTPLMHAMQLTDIVMSRRPGAEITLHVMRGETPLTINVTLGESNQQPMGTMRRMHPAHSMEPRMGLGTKIVRPHLAPPSTQGSVPSTRVPHPHSHIGAPLLPPMWDPFASGLLSPGVHGFSFPGMLGDVLLGDSHFTSPMNAITIGDPVIHESDDKIEIRVPFPAVNAQVSVDVSSRSVVLSTTIEERREESRDGRVIHYQSRQGTSVRSIHLPTSVKFAEAEGWHDNGHIVIVIPKAQTDAAGRHQIIIGVTKPDDDKALSE